MVKSCKDVEIRKLRETFYQKDSRSLVLSGYKLLEQGRTLTLVKMFPLYRNKVGIREMDQDLFIQLVSLIS